MTEKKRRGRPGKLDTRLTATLAVDLASQYNLFHRIAAAVAWQTMRQLSPSQFRTEAPPYQVEKDLMRKIKAGRPRIEYSPALWRQALRCLPENVRPDDAEIAKAYPPKSIAPEAVEILKN